MSQLLLPPRTNKPRSHGITAVTDLGTPVRALRELLEDFHPFIDIAKFGVGSAYVMPRLDEKLAVYREFGVIPYFGGTLFEKFYYQNNVSGYARYCRQHRVDWIEISNGTIDLSLSDRLDLVETLKGDFRILAEVGCKDTDRVMAPSEWIHELQALLEAGANYVITEGRDSATAGIYRASGEIRQGLLSDIIKTVDSTKVIFEAPNPANQMYFINLLGNVALKDLLLLETQRCALRYETFYTLHE